MPKRNNYQESEDVQSHIEWVENLLLELRKEKDKFANAFQTRSFEEMNTPAENIILYVSETANAFAYHQEISKKRKQRIADLKKVRDFRQDTQIRNFVVSLRNSADQLREDFRGVNLSNFVIHTNQAEYRIYLLLLRIGKVVKNGIDDTKTQKARLKQTKRMKENLPDWKNWIENEKAICREKPFSLTGEISSILSKYTEGDFDE